MKLLSKFLCRSSSDDVACSESSYSPDSDCSETSVSESEDTLSEVQQPGSSGDDAAGAQPSTSRDPPQNDPQSNAARNSFICINLQLLSYPRFPLMTTSMQTYSCNAFNTTGNCSFKVFFPKSLCILIAQCTNERIDLHSLTSKKCYDSPYQRRTSDDSFKGYVCNVL